MTKKEQAEQKARDLEYLNGMVTPTRPLQITMRYLSGGRTLRGYDVYLISGNELIRITPFVARLAGYRYDTKRELLMVNGAQFSGACDIAHSLARAMGFDSPCKYHEF